MQMLLNRYVTCSMKIWLLEGGVKTGPHESYSVRDRVSNGELTAETSAWYDGADSWMPLAKVPSMVSAFAKSDGGEVARGDSHEEFIDKVKVSAAEETHELPKLHMGRRFSARLIDVMLYFALMNGVKLLLQVDIYLLLEPTQQFFYYIPYVIIDALLIHVWGTTVGKYFMGISMYKKGGDRISIGASLLRSGRVWVIGLGMFTMLAPLTFLFSWFISRKHGKFLWDLRQSTEVRVEAIKPLKVVAAVFSIIMVSSIVNMSVPEEMKLKGESVEEVLEDWERRNNNFQK